MIDKNDAALAFSIFIFYASIILSTVSVGETSMSKSMLFITTT